MREYMLLLGLMSHSGDGVGLDILAKKSNISRYKVRKMLKELVSMNFVERKANRFFRNSFGTMLVEADNGAWFATLQESEKS